MIAGAPEADQPTWALLVRSLNALLGEWLRGYTAVMALKLLPSDPKPRSFLPWATFSCRSVYLFHEVNMKLVTTVCG